MYTPSKRALTVLATSAVFFALAACDQSSPPTVGQKVDKAIEQTQQAATEAKRDVQSIAAKATKETAEVATDVTITAKVKTALAVDSQLSALDINVDTVKGVVSLWGRAPSEEAVKRATTLTKGVEGVTEVKNQLTVVAKN